MRRRTADTAGPKEALTIISEKNRKTNGSLDVLEFEHAVIFVTFGNMYRKRPLQFVLISKQSRRPARLFVSIQKFVLGRL